MKTLEEERAKLQHELVMFKLQNDLEMKRLEREHELKMLELRGGWLGRIFGCK